MDTVSLAGLKDVATMKHMLGALRVIALLGAYSAMLLAYLLRVTDYEGIRRPLDSTCG